MSDNAADIRIDFNIWKYIILSILTLGIYPLYIYCRLSSSTTSIEQNLQEEPKTMPYYIVIVVSIIVGVIIGALIGKNNLSFTTMFDSISICLAILTAAWLLHITLVVNKLSNMLVTKVPKLANAIPSTLDIWQWVKWTIVIPFAIILSCTGLYGLINWTSSIEPELTSSDNNYSLSEDINGEEVPTELVGDTGVAGTLINTILMIITVFGPTISQLTYLGKIIGTTNVLAGIKISYKKRATRKN